MYPILINTSLIFVVTASTFLINRVNIFLNPTEVGFENINSVNLKRNTRCYGPSGVLDQVVLFTTGTTKLCPVID